MLFLIFLLQMSVSLTYCLFFPESITGYFGASVLLCWNHHPRYRCKHCLLCQRHLRCSQGYLATAGLSCACASIPFLPRGLSGPDSGYCFAGRGRVGWLLSLVLKGNFTSSCHCPQHQHSEKGQIIGEGDVILILFNGPQDSQQALLSPGVQSDVTCQFTELRGGSNQS